MNEIRVYDAAGRLKKTISSKQATRMYWKQLKIDDKGVSARLRYRVRENKLGFIYLLDRPEKIVETAFKATMDKIGTGTGLPMFLGSR